MKANYRILTADRLVTFEDSFTTEIDVNNFPCPIRIEFGYFKDFVGRAVISRREIDFMFLRDMEPNWFRDQEQIEDAIDRRLAPTEVIYTR